MTKISDLPYSVYHLTKISMPYLWLDSKSILCFRPALYLVPYIWFSWRLSLPSWQVCLASLNSVTITNILMSHSCVAFHIRGYECEWRNVYLYTAHITYCLKAVYNSNWVRPNVRHLWLPLSVHIWSHSPTQSMHEMYSETTDRPPHREPLPLLFSTSVWVL